jgi:hypothetical protein
MRAVLSVVAVPSTAVAGTRRGLLEMAAQSCLDGIADRALGTRKGPDPELFEHHNGPAPHATGNNHIRALSVDEAWHLTRLMVLIVRIADD